MKLRNSDEELYVPKNEYWRNFSSMFRCQFLVELTLKRIEFLKCGKLDMKKFVWVEELWDWKKLKIHNEIRLLYKFWV